MFGGKWMDTFMDKLAQRLTAQEMIKANTAADAEEMKKLKSQVKEYRDILEQMQGLIADGAQKLEAAKVDGDEINRLVEAGVAKINQLQCESGETAKLQETMSQIELSLNLKINSLNETMNQLEQALDAKMNEAGDTIKRLGQSVDEKLGGASETLGAAVEPLGAKIDNMNDSMHKECVKVYRNVQAVVVEENTKQAETLAGAVKSLKGKLGAVLGVSIVALIAALGGVVFQVLVYLQVI